MFKTLHFFSTTPESRIISRYTPEIYSILAWTLARHMPVKIFAINQGKTKEIILTQKIDGKLGVYFMD